MQILQSRVSTSLLIELHALLVAADSNRVIANMLTGSRKVGLEF